MKTYARVYRFDPIGWDIFAPCTDLKRGALVRKCQPVGCPRNGTMGHCYVAHADSGEFVGLVLVNSLVPAGRAT